jgi:hypothetical protein
MARFARLQFQQFILDLQFFALQFEDLAIILPRMMLLSGDFFLERLVATLEFDDMTLQGHAKPPSFILFPTGKGKTACHNPETAQAPCAPAPLHRPA